MTVEKKDIDWGSLGFGYMKTDYSYEAHWKDGEWDEGGLTTDHTLHVSECGGIFHYCQEVFEGLKAYTAEDGSIVCFRPDMNAERCITPRSASRCPRSPRTSLSRPSSRSSLPTPPGFRLSAPVQPCMCVRL